MPHSVAAWGLSLSRSDRVKPGFRLGPNPVGLVSLQEERRGRRATGDDHVRSEEKSAVGTPWTEASGGASPAPHLDLRCPASGTMRKLPDAEATQAVVRCYGGRQGALSRFGPSLCALPRRLIPPPDTSFCVSRVQCMRVTCIHLSICVGASSRTCRAALMTGIARKPHVYVT